VVPRPPRAPLYIAVTSLNLKSVDVYFPVLMFALFAALIVAFAFAAFRAERKRRDALASAAARLG